MERIQFAIAKARAARADEQTKGGPDLDDRVAPVADSSPLILTRALNPVTPAPASEAAEALAPTKPAGPPSAETIAEAWLELPDFAPKPRLMHRGRIVAFQGGREGLSFDVMRTRLLQQMRANKWRRVAVTSPSAGCGKSTVAANLAFSLARQQDQRTLLIEMDMQRPSLSKTLGIRSHQNFAKVLEGTAAFAENAVRYGTNLAIATQSKPVHNSAELFQSAQAGAALDDIAARYAPTVMIFDMPPMLAGDAVMAFAGSVDCVLLVAAAEETTIKQIDVCERDLATQTNFLGVVLNRCRYMSGEDSYGYYG